VPDHITPLRPDFADFGRGRHAKLT